MKKAATACALLAAGVTMASSPLHAQNPVAKEIFQFQSVRAGLSPGAAECNLKDANKFASYLSERLQAAGLQREPASRIVATLSIAGKSFGMLGARCAYNVVFQIQAVLSAAEITIPDPRVRAALDRLGSLPVVIYQDGFFGVVVLSGPQDGPDSAEDQVRKVIVSLVERLKTARDQ